MRKISGQSFLNLNDACDRSAGVKQALFLCSAGLLIGVLAAEPAYGGTVYGKLVNEKKSVTITLKPDSPGKDYRVKTNDDGEYSILLPVGSYTVNINTIGGQCNKIRSYDVPVRQDIKC